MTDKPDKTHRRSGAGKDGGARGPRGRPRGHKTGGRPGTERSHSRPKSAGTASEGGRALISAPPRESQRPDEGRLPKRQGAKPTAARSKGPRSKPFARGDRALVTHRAGGEGERIAKRLARAGVASRRAAEEMVLAGRVAVNGKVIDTPALDVRMSDRIEIDGQPIPAIERTRLFLFHKPAGTVTTNRDPEGRRTIFDTLPQGLPRLVSVGRLDIATEGLLILTNDGGLARQLELPSTGWLRRYRVRVHGKVDEAALAALKDGVAIDGVYYGSVEASLDRVQGSNAWLTIGLREGKNREVRNILSHLGLEVSRLIRVSYGPFQLGELDRGEVREIRGAVLREQLGQKLVDEAGANFEAPILKPFSSKSQATGGGRGEPAQAPGQNRKRARAEKREAALGKLQTRPAGKPKSPHAKKGKPGSGGGGEARPKAEAGKRGEQQPRSRGTHVWMAPGARPLSKKQLEEKARETEGRRYAGKPRPARPRKPGKDR